jgi:hypothetical protein
VKELETYLDFLYGNNIGHVYVPTRPEGVWETSWFEWPRQKLELTDFIRTQSRVADVHIGVALFNKHSGLKKDVASTQVVWCEFDGNFVGDWKGIPEPNLMIQSSGEQNVHCYWKIETLSEVSAIEEITYRLAYHLDADEGCWNANRVLRPPETQNFKRGEPLPVKIIKLDETLKFSTKDFDKAERVLKVPQPFITADVIEWSILKSRLPLDLVRRVDKYQVKEGDRSSFYFKVAVDLARLGFNEQEVFSTLYVLDERIRKYADRNDRLERLASIAAKVILPIISARKIEAYTIEDLLALIEPEMDWIIPDILPAGDIGFLAGQPGVGKTQLAIWMSRLLAAGRPVFSDVALDPIKVLFFSKEIHRRLLRIFLEKQDLMLRGLGMKNFICAFPEMTHGLQSMKDLLDEFKPDLLVVDSLVQMVPSLKDEELLKQAIDNVLAVAGKSAVIFVHHVTKASYDSKDGPTLKDFYGAMYPLTIASSVMTLHGESPNLIVKLLKNRYGPLAEFTVHRTEYLTFEVRGASKRPGDVKDSPGGNPKLPFRNSL